MPEPFIDSTRRLYHASVRALDEPKVVFEDPEEESFYALSSRTKRFHNLDLIKSCFEMANCCRQNSCKGALRAWRILLKSKWVGIVEPNRAVAIGFCFFCKIKGAPSSPG